MRKLLFVTLISWLLFFNNVTFAINNNLSEKNELSLIYTDISNSADTLTNINRNPASIVQRAYYITELQKITNDFHYLAEKNISIKNKMKLNRLALVLMGLLNTQQKLGIDANGDFGKNIFSDINSHTLMSKRVKANRNNQGRADLFVDIETVDPLAASDYQLKFIEETHYTLMRLSDNRVVNSGTITGFPQYIRADGFVIRIINGNFIQNDKFLISPLNDAARQIQLIISDPSLLAMAWPIETNANTHQDSSLYANITGITDTDNESFSIAKQLNPPIVIRIITTTEGLIGYQVFNQITNQPIDDPMVYSPSNSIFPTTHQYDPGYRLMLSGSPKTGDAIQVVYNTNTGSDNRNGVAMRDLYNRIPLN